MASIARKNLLEDIPRFLVAQAGIMFAVSLVTIQLGILKGFTRSTALLVDNSTADIWVASQELVHLELTMPLPLSLASQAQEVEGVQRVEILINQSARWRNQSGKIAPVRVIGFDPQGTLFQPWNLQVGSVAALQQPYQVLLDQSNFGSLGVRNQGDTAQISALPATVAGWVQGTQSIASSAFLYTSLETANAYATAGLQSDVQCRLEAEGLVCTSSFNRVDEDPKAAPPKALSGSDAITYLLIRARPNEDLAALKERLDRALPGTRAFTREELSEQTRIYWRDRTGVGFILGLGASVGVVVGMVIVGQILYSSVSDHLKEFGTLKAMGASDWIIYRVIVEQALWMAILGYFPSIALCMGLGAWTMATQGIMILITPTTALILFGVTVGMCASSAVFAIQKVTRVDPAIVFKA